MIYLISVKEYEKFFLKALCNHPVIWNFTSFFILRGGKIVLKYQSSVYKSCALKWVHTRLEFEQENDNWVWVMQRAWMWHAQSLILHLCIKLTLYLWLAGAINMIAIWINTFYFQIWPDYKPFEVLLMNPFCEHSSNCHCLLHTCAGGLAYRHGELFLQLHWAPAHW